MPFATFFITAVFFSTVSWGQSEADAPVYSISPMNHVILPTGSNDSKSVAFTIANRGASPLRLKLEVLERLTSEAIEKRRPTKDLILDRSDVTVESGKSETVRLEYKPAEPPKYERAFRVTTRPVGGYEESRFEIRVVYEASIFVAPPGAKPDVVVLSTRKMAADIFQVELKNRGSAHFNLSDAELILESSVRNSSGSNQESVQGKEPNRIALSEESRALLRRSTILAGATRSIALKINPGQELTGDQSLRVKLLPK